MPQVRREAILTLFFCTLVGGYVILASQSFPQPADAQGFGEGPGFYPQVLGWSLLALGALNALQGLRRRRKQAAAEGAGEAALPAEKPRFLLVAGVLLLSVLDILLMQFLGFFAAGFVLVLAMLMMILPPRSAKAVLWDLVFSAGMVALVYLVFEVFVKIQLPRGLWLD